QSPNRVLDLGSVYWGRSDAMPANLDTRVVLNVSGMEPWQTDSDDLAFFSLGASAWGYSNGLGNNGVSDISAGSTSLIGYPLYASNLVDATKGDRAVLTQERRQQLGPGSSNPANGVYLTSIAKIAHLAPFTMVDRGTTPVDGLFDPAPAPKPLQLTW